MKDHVEIGHLTKYDTFRVNRDQVMDLEIMKKIKSLYDFGRRCLKIRDVCMDFEPYFKVHNLVSVHPSKHHTWSNDQS